MSPRLRLALAILGLVVIALALLALAYAAWPLESTVDQAPIAPTLFQPPQSFIALTRFG